LPAELRVIVYEYCLVCSRPIDFGYNGQLNIHNNDEVSVQLLRTCRTIKEEGGQVFYGENHFRFWRERDFFMVGRELPAHNLAWLKTLTFAVPFTYWDHTILLHSDCVEWVSTVPPSNRIVDLNTYRVDYIANRLVMYVLDAVANATCLQKLHLVIPPNWKYDQRSDLDGVDMSTPDDNGYLDCCLNPSDVWQDFETLARRRPFLFMTVTRLYYRGLKVVCAKELELERFLKRLKQQVGVWDQREAELNEEMTDWETPDMTKDNPDEYLRSIQTLFRDMS
jgi:hypothetical protein